MEEGDEEEESGLPRPSWRDEKLLSQKINNYETVSWDTFSVQLFPPFAKDSARQND